MELGFFGLGVTGTAVVRRLLAAGRSVTGYARRADLGHRRDAGAGSRLVRLGNVIASPTVKYRGPFVLDPGRPGSTWT
jgi:3-hydroxyisobutyrate dehydrogenase-like beta-hydroxyacid dehydrogenase